MDSLLGGFGTGVGRLGRIFAKAPVSYAPRATQWLTAMLGAGGQEGQMRAMGSVGTLFAIVTRLANSTAAVDWKLWRKAPSGKDDDRVEITSHLALDIWNNPVKPFFPGQLFRETFQQHLELVGEAWWVVSRSEIVRSIPLELWPVRPDRMRVVPSPEKYIQGYIYVGPNGEQVPLELDEVIQLRMPNPLDPYRGMGPVQSILVDLDSTRYSAEWNRNFFLNSAEPGGIIEYPTELSESQWEKTVKRWREQHQGVSNAHRVAVIEKGKWVERQFNMRDMQFAELRGVSREVIREAYGIPKFAVGDVEDVNRATADAAAVWFGRQLTVPRLERIKGALNGRFLPLFGATSANLEFDYENPVPEDEEAERNERDSKATAAKTYIVDCGFEHKPVLEYLELPADWELKPTPAPAAPMPPGSAAGEGTGSAQPAPGAPTARLELVMPPFDQEAGWEPFATRGRKRRTENPGRTS